MSCWDTTACLKTLCTAYNDYQKSTTDEAIKDLQRQIDVSIYWETTAIYKENRFAVLWQIMLIYFSSS